MLPHGFLFFCHPVIWRCLENITRTYTQNTLLHTENRIHTLIHTFTQTPIRGSCIRTTLTSTISLLWQNACTYRLTTTACNILILIKDQQSSHGVNLYKFGHNLLLRQIIQALWTVEYMFVLHSTVLYAYKQYKYAFAHSLYCWLFLLRAHYSVHCLALLSWECLFGFLHYKTVKIVKYYMYYSGATLEDRFFFLPCYSLPLVFSVEWMRDGFRLQPRARGDSIWMFC